MTPEAAKIERKLNLIAENAANRIGLEIMIRLNLCLRLLSEEAQKDLHLSIRATVLNAATEALVISELPVTQGGSLR